MSTKTYAERVKESVHLLKQIKDMGIKPEHPGYSDLKNNLDEWIKNETQFSGKIDFPLQSRRGQLMLPMKTGTTSTFNLKHHVF